jgi:hypothetical protein
VSSIDEKQQRETQPGKLTVYEIEPAIEKCQPYRVALSRREELCSYCCSRVEPTDDRREGRNRVLFLQPIPLDIKTITQPRNIRAN